jgi:hypothetical protein
MNESVRYPGLFVLKYKRVVFFDSLWNDYLEECRGAVVDKDFNFVIRPFTKIYNRGERGTDIQPDADCVIIRKVNGFMAAATYVPALDKVIVSTTGSLDSEFVTMAEEFIDDKMKEEIKRYFLSPHITWLFEIVHPNDPHIIKEQVGAWLIGARNIHAEAKYHSSVDHELWLDECAKMFGFMRPSWDVKRFGDVVKEAKECKHEGFVVYEYPKGTALKIKSPHYLMTKFFARIGIERLTTLSRETLRQRIDEEFYDLIDLVMENKEEFIALREQDRIAKIEEWLNG